MEARKGLEGGGVDMAIGGAVRLRSSRERQVLHVLLYGLETPKKETEVTRCLIVYLHVSRDQILRRERGQGNIHFPCSADHEQEWQPYPVDPYSCSM